MTMKSHTAARYLPDRHL